MVEGRLHDAGALLLLAEILAPTSIASRHGPDSLWPPDRQVLTMPMLKSSAKQGKAYEEHSDAKSLSDKGAGHLNFSGIYIRRHVRASLRGQQAFPVDRKSRTRAKCPTNDQ